MLGYDDSRGDYRLVTHDHIDYRYEILGELGKGSFGQVVKVKDHKNGNIMALKLVRNKKRFHKQAMIEVKVLDHIMKKVGDDVMTICRHGVLVDTRACLCRIPRGKPT